MKTLKFIIVPAILLTPIIGELIAKINKYVLTGDWTIQLNWDDGV